MYVCVCHVWLILVILYFISALYNLASFLLQKRELVYLNQWISKLCVCGQHCLCFYVSSFFCEVSVWDYIRFWGVTLFLYFYNMCGNYHLINKLHIQRILYLLYSLFCLKTQVWNSCLIPHIVSVLCWYSSCYALLCTFCSVWNSLTRKRDLVALL